MLKPTSIHHLVHVLIENYEKADQGVLSENQYNPFIDDIYFVFEINKIEPILTGKKWKSLESQASFLCKEWWWASHMSSSFRSMDFEEIEELRSAMGRELYNNEDRTANWIDLLSHKNAYLRFIAVDQITDRGNYDPKLVTLLTDPHMFVSDNVVRCFRELALPQILKDIKEHLGLQSKGDIGRAITAVYQGMKPQGYIAPERQTE